MKIDIITIFPEETMSLLGAGMIRLARERGIVEIQAHDLRNFSENKHRQIDDEPYGGGPGMVMEAEPIFRAVGSLVGDTPGLLPSGTRTCLLTPNGRRFDQHFAQSLTGAEHLIFTCGRYEGVDDRVSAFMTDEISIGDYVLSGGEMAAMVVIDAVTRLLPGVLGDQSSLNEESFVSGLEYPQYTRPALWRGFSVPEVLLSGDHGRIAEWRRDRSVERTMARRPDLS